jgi:hypothetical protein
MTMAVPKIPYDKEYITGHTPKIKRMVRDSINNMKSLHYMCEENISLLEQLQEEVDKL